MSTTTFEPRTLVRVNNNYPDAQLHGREGVLTGYSDDRKPRAVIAFFTADGDFETTRFLFDSELEAAHAAAPQTVPNDAELIANARTWASNFHNSKGAERLNTHYYLESLADRLEAHCNGTAGLPDEPSDALVDRMAEAAALYEDHDGCFERIRDWEALEEWEREAHPDNHPGSDYEDAAVWRGRIRAAWDAAHPDRPLFMSPTECVAIEVRDERAAQSARWGMQSHPDGTGPNRMLLRTGKTYSELEAAAKDATDTATAAGRVTYADILLEEAMEALAETDPARLRKELIQLAAVAVQWVEAIDRRPNPS